MSYVRFSYESDVYVYEDIGGYWAVFATRGNWFYCETPGDAANTLLMLRLCGMEVPQYAIDALVEDAGS